MEEQREVAQLAPEGSGRSLVSFPYLFVTFTYCLFSNIGQIKRGVVGGRFRKIMGTKLQDHLSMGLTSIPVGSKFIEGPCSCKNIFLGDDFFFFDEN